MSLGLQKKDRRTKMEIYHDMLCAIKTESEFGEVRPTRIQFAANLSYDKMILHMDDLLKHELLSTKSPFTVSDKGRMFIQRYETIKQLLCKISNNYELN